MGWELWDGAVDELISEIFRTLAIEQPPVDALSIVRAVGCELAFDASQWGRARQKTIDGQTAVFLKPDDRPERLQWAAAHELGEIFAWQICEKVAASLEELPNGFREQLAHRFASRLLLPTTWYSEDLRESGADLHSLKTRYRTASHELISRRLLDFFPHRILTIVDQGRVVLRQNGYQSRPGPLCAMERQLVAACRESGRTVSRDSDDIRCEVWPVHEPDWKREILFTYASCESFCDPAVDRVYADETAC